MCHYTVENIWKSASFSRRDADLKLIHAGYIDMMSPSSISHIAHRWNSVVASDGPASNGLKCIREIHHAPYIPIKNPARRTVYQRRPKMKWHYMTVPVISRPKVVLSESSNIRNRLPTLARAGRKFETLGPKIAAILLKL